MKRIIFPAIVTGILLFTLSITRAANHALLIGIGSYPGLSAMQQLEGPPFDVESLRNVLEKSFGFPPANVTTLVNGQASRTGILNALDNLVPATKPDDFIFLYFSGHGTSSYDPDRKEWGLDPLSGALMPSDFKTGEIKDMVAQLIIGTRDIKPRLMKLDKDRRILAVFDACFSELTVRSTGSFPRGRAEQAGKPKIVPLEDLTGEEMPGIYGTDTLKQPRYPYRNVIYMAASGRRQYALDIGQKDSKMTIDGNPHGAMTDAMLRAFSGQGDTNNDKTITYEELYQYIKVRVSEKFSQSPQRLFPKDNTAMLDQPVFKGVKINKKLPSLPVLNNTLRIRTHGLPPGLEKKIAGIQGITIADKDYDILLTAKTMAGSETETKIYVYLPNDSLITAVSPKKAVDLIRGQMRVRELILSSYPGQSFNVFADINNYNGVLKEGETVGFTIRVEEDSYILLMNIEPDGFINILYPCEPHELAVVKAGQQLSLDGQNEVKGPNFGTEYIKVFAFRTQPGNMKYIMNGEFDPTDPLFRRLMKMVRNPEIEAAQMTMQVTTCAKDDIVRGLK